MQRRPRRKARGKLRVARVERVAARRRRERAWRVVVWARVVWVARWRARGRGRRRERVVRVV